MNGIIDKYTRNIVGNIAVIPDKGVIKFDGQIFWRVK